MSTRTSDRYPETLAKRSASSKASSVALVWRRWAIVARRGCTTSTRGGLSAFVDFSGDVDAARCQSATMPAVPTPTTTTKTLMPVPFVKFMVSTVLAVALIPLPEHGVRRGCRHHPTLTRGAARNSGFAGHQDRATRKPGHAATEVWPGSPAG